MNYHFFSCFVRLIWVQCAKPKCDKLFLLHLHTREGSFPHGEVIYVVIISDHDGYHLLDGALIIRGSEEQARSIIVLYSNNVNIDRYCGPAWTQLQKRRNIFAIFCLCTCWARLPRAAAAEAMLDAVRTWCRITRPVSAIQQPVGHI